MINMINGLTALQSGYYPHFSKKAKMTGWVVAMAMFLRNLLSKSNPGWSKNINYSGTTPFPTPNWSYFHSYPESG